jgi:tetratricopeptide (TPR) repeat protein
LKKKLIIIGIALLLILIICIVVFFRSKKLQDLVKGTTENAESTSAMVEVDMPDWVPFVVDETYGSSPLSGFLYSQQEVKSASEREAYENSSDSEKTMEGIKKRVPDYLFEEVPLLKPAMVVSAEQKVFEEDVIMGILFYTEASFDEALDFYKNALEKYDNYKEDTMDASTGITYTLSVDIERKYKTHASVMVMEMPETTGYTCALNISIRVREAAKKEPVVIENRPDGLPGNYPDELLPVFKVKEVFDASGDDEGSYVQYFSSGSYSEAVDFFRNAMEDKTDFYEESEIEGEIYFSCRVPGWYLSVRIMENDGLAYIEAYCNIEQ